MPYLFLFQCLFIPLNAQTFSIKLLPSQAQKALKDFVFIAEGIYDQGLFTGEDSLPGPLPEQTNVKSFYINRFEVTVAEYQVFLNGNSGWSNHYDSAVWTKDYPYSFNEPMNRNYFWHPKFKQHPVVGITWEQAVQYCAWKTAQLNQLLEKTPYRITVRLPNSSEWEYAALGLSAPDHSKSARYFSPKNRRIYPWNGLFLQQEKEGHFYMNCNSGAVTTPEGVYVFQFPSDGFLYTAPVKSFGPNNVGLYQMAGNVAEWTSDNYAIVLERYKTLQDEQEDGKNINPAFMTKLSGFKPAEQFSDYKIIKGGSWVDGPFYMQAGTVKIQAPNKASCTTGFRPALVIEKK